MRAPLLVLLAALLLALPSAASAQGKGNTLPALSAESSGAAEAEPELWWLPLAGLGAAAAAVAVVGATRGTRPFTRPWAGRVAVVLAALLLVGAYTVGAVIARDPDERARYGAPADPLAPLGKP